MIQESRVHVRLHAGGHCCLHGFANRHYRISSRTCTSPADPAFCKGGGACSVCKNKIVSPHIPASRVFIFFHSIHLHPILIVESKSSDPPVASFTRRLMQISCRRLLRMLRSITGPNPHFVYCHFELSTPFVNMAVMSKT